jgi:hypothetical protein
MIPKEKLQKHLNKWQLIILSGQSSQDDCFEWTALFCAVDPLFYSQN